MPDEVSARALRREGAGPGAAARRRPGPGAFVLAALGLALSACGEREPRVAGPGGDPAAPPFTFTDVADQAGLTHPTCCGRPEKPHLLESGGSGLALLDYDADGDLDAYVVRAWRLDGAQIVEKGTNRLYRNRGDGRFEDVTQAAGVGDDGWGNGVAVGDPDGDGDPDLYVSNFGPDVLYLNRGDGTFDRRPAPEGTDGWSTGAVFFDADGDGDEDLFVAGYIDVALQEVLEAKPTLDWKSAKVMFGPFGLRGLANRYFRNEGAARFVEATHEAGLEDVGLYYSFTCVAFDMDRDLDLDLFVANDSNPNYLYRNAGQGRFEETGLWSGAALSASGASQAGMGVASGDVDGDGLTDLLVTNFAEDTCTLYRNLGRGLFRDVSAAAGLIEPTTKPLSWGTVLEDFDLDGDVDLFIANGHIYPQADSTPGSGTTYAQRNLLLQNAGGRFTDVTARSGPGLEVVKSSRGVAAGDIDGDGDVDLLVSNVDATPTLLRNDTRRRGTWLMVDAPRALRVEVVAGGRTFVRDRVRGGSYVSASDSRFHFGLGDAPAAERVTLLWPEGRTTVRERVPTGQVLKVREGG